jgi:hypothetical protein
MTKGLEEAEALVHQKQQQEGIERVISAPPIKGNAEQQL